MNLLDSLTVYHGKEPRYIELYHGDLTDLSEDEAVEILVVSAFPNNYSPSSGSLIGALFSKGISIEDLAETKAVDLRDSFSCWLSPILHVNTPGIQFNRILCFEPIYRGHPSQVIGDIFQCLTPFVTGYQTPIKVAMPLVSTGDHGIPISVMLEPLIDAAVHWLELGLPISHLRVVQRSEKKALETKGAFSILKKRYEKPSIIVDFKYKYDLFVSYSHENLQEIEFLVNELYKTNPSANIFFDKKTLHAGFAWQQEIYESLDNCRKVVAVYSPTYLSSKVCKEEFNIALFRHRDSNNATLIPLYLYSANLPSYMKLVQYIDCREGNREKIKQASQLIFQSFNNLHD